MCSGALAEARMHGRWNVALCARWRVWVPLCVLLVTAASGTASGQAGTGVLAGSVKDSQGGALPGAAVTATNDATGAARTTPTNESGAFNMPGMPPGTYTVKAELGGFKTAVHEKVLLQVDTTTRIEPVLAVGNLAETVTVTDISPVLNTTDASVGQTMNRETIERLPVEGRNVVHLLSLQPGAVFIPTANANTVDPRYGAVSGARADQ